MQKKKEFIQVREKIPEKKRQAAEVANGLYSPKRKMLIMRSPDEMTIGERLKRERYLRKLTQEQMALYLGISPSYLGAMERGKRPVSRKMMDLLHERLNLSYDFMLEGMSITGAAIAQYVRETTDYSTAHKVNVLLNVCSEEELESCYQLIHTHLVFLRNRAKSQ